MTTTCTYLQQLTQVSDVAHGPLVFSRQLINVIDAADNHYSSKFHFADFCFIFDPAMCENHIELQHTKKGWMTCNFTPFSTVFQSHQDNGRVIMKGKLGMEPHVQLKRFLLPGDTNPGMLGSQPALNPLS